MALQSLFIRGWKQLSAYHRPEYKAFTNNAPCKGNSKMQPY